VKAALLEAGESARLAARAFRRDPDGDRITELSVRKLESANGVRGILTIDLDEPGIAPAMKGMRKISFFATIRRGMRSDWKSTGMS
jgi:hypothetical protein